MGADSGKNNNKNQKLKTKKLGADSEWDKIRNTMMWGLADFMHRMDRAGRRFSDTERDACYFALRTCLVCYQWLSVEK